MGVHGSQTDTPKISKLHDPSKLGGAESRLPPIPGYSVESVLGTGAFSDVFHGSKTSTGQRVAVKRINSQPNFCTDEENEFAIGRLLNANRHIISTLTSLRIDQVEYIVFDYAPGGDLFDALEASTGGVSLEKCRFYMRDAAAGLQWIHSQGIIHADVKLENMLLAADGSVKLTDFGLSGFAKSVRKGRPYGTSAYMPPELMSLRSSQSKYSLEEGQDVWAFGIVLYGVIFADLPWERARMTDPDFLIFFRNDGVSSQLEPFGLLSSQIQQLFVGLLHLDGKKRPSMTTVREFFESDNPWLKKSGYAERSRAVSDPVPVVFPAKKTNETASGSGLPKHSPEHSPPLTSTTRQSMAKHDSDNSALSSRKKYQGIVKNHLKIGKGFAHSSPNSRGQSEKHI